MKEKLVLTIIATILLSILPVVSADLIDPDFKYIPIENKITNMNDFSDYYLVATCKIMGEPRIIESDGIIPNFYKFCSVSIYAIKKENLNFPIIIEDETSNKHLDLYSKNLTLQNFEEYLENNGWVKLAENIHSTQYSPVSNPVEKINNNYKLDIGTIKSNPDSERKDYSTFRYLYFIIPIIAIIIIILIIVKRKK